MLIVIEDMKMFFFIFAEDLFPILCERAGLPKDTKLLWFEVPFLFIFNNQLIDYLTFRPSIRATNQKCFI